MRNGRFYRIQPILLNRARQMRAESAPAEAILWKLLRNRALEGLKFRRQVAIDQFVADFYCAEHRLIIELDGESHFDRRQYDQTRTERLAELGYRVVRFDNPDVFDDIEVVFDAIYDACFPEPPASGGPSPQPSPPSTGERG